MKKRDFLENFFDLSNSDYNILRLINEKIHFLEQNTKVLAVFGGIGKTVLAEKYPNLCSDIEVTGYRYDYDDEVIDCERIKGSINRKKNHKYPNNYISKIGEKFNKKALLTVVLSEEVLHKLDRMGICYDMVYPRKRMKEELTRRMRLSGNNNTFIEKIEQILDDYLELDYLKRNLRIDKIYYADNSDTLEDIVVREGIIDELILNNSVFEYKEVRYNVCFCPHKEDMHEEETNFTQVYCVRIINEKVLVIFHKDKNGKKSITYQVGLARKEKI